MSVFGARKEFLDVNMPKTSISASAAVICKKWSRLFKSGLVNYNTQLPVESDKKTR